MKNALVLAKKDALSYFRSWLGVLFFIFFYLIAGIFFSLLILSYAKISFEVAKDATHTLRGVGLVPFVLSSFFLNQGVVLMFLVPLLSMRAVAEEHRQETLELLFTYPFSDFEIVLGKFLGMVGFFVALTLPLAGYLFFLAWFGGGLDWGSVFLGFLGFWLLGSAYLSLGLFISAISENQIACAIATFAVLILFWVLDWVASLASGGWGHFFGSLSPLSHYREFPLGILDLSHVVYFLFFQLYFLFLSLRAIEVRNWKG